MGVKKFAHYLNAQYKGTGADRAWVMDCRCGASFVHPAGERNSYGAAEDKWRRHVYEETGVAPDPMGSNDGRWFPDGAA